MVNDPWGTHLPVIAACAFRAEGRILELGSGNYSTCLLHSIAKHRGVELVTIDNNAEWLAKFRHMEGPGHRFILATDWGKVAEIDQDNYFVFVDHAPAEQRRIDLGRLRSRTLFVAVHDTEEHSYGLKPVLERYRYQYHWNKLSPWTTVVSDFEPVDFMKAV